MSYAVVVWTGTTYENFFKSAASGSPANNLWKNVIKDSEYQLPSIASGLEKLIKVN